MIKQKLKRLTIIVTSVIIFAVAPVPALVSAESISELQQKKDQLQREIDANNSQVKALAVQQDSLAKAIQQLNIDIDNANKEIQKTEYSIAVLKDKLTKTQAELDRQTNLLRDTLRELYKQSGASTVELLLSSDNFNDFVTGQEYLERLKSGIQASTEKVVSLKKQLEEQKAEQDKLLAQQEVQRDRLATDKQKQQDLLTYAQGQEALYRQYVSDLVEKQRAVNRQLAAALQARNVRYGSATRGGYPDVWNNAPMDSLIDDWGMFNRECVSYTAWRSWSTGHVMPYWGGIGNANQWPGNARAAGYRVDNSPEVGSVAISMAGYYGHAMFVESVNGDGTITVSQYNFDWNGTYSEMTVYPGSLLFIHFPLR